MTVKTVIKVVVEVSVNIQRSLHHVRIFFSQTHKQCRL